MRRVQTWLKWKTLGAMPRTKGKSSSSHDSTQPTRSRSVLPDDPRAAPAAGTGAAASRAERDSDVSALSDTKLQTQMSDSQQLSKLRAIARNVPVFIAYIDAQLRIRYVNKPDESWYGRFRPQLVGKSFPEVVGERAFQQIEDYVALALIGREVTFEETDNIPGGIRCRQTTFIPDLGKDSKVSGFFAVVCDITQQRVSELALRESEERFRQLAENIDQVFWITDPARERTLYVSPAYQRIWKRSARNLLVGATRWTDHIHPQDRRRVAAEIQQAIAAERDFTVEYRILRPDEEIRWIRDRGFPVRDENGRVYRIAGIAEDITERLQALESLRESEERFRQLAENIREVFWMTSADGERVLYVSPAVKDIWGFSPAEIIRRPRLWYESIHSEDRDRVRESFCRVTKETIEEEYRVVRPDGSIRWIRDRGFPITDAQGRVYRIAGIAEDVTERKRALDALRHSEALYQSLVENLPLCVLRTDRDGRFVFANRTLRKLTGLHAERLDDKTYSDILPEDCAAEHRDGDAHVLASGGTWETTHRIHRDDATTYLQVLKAPVRDASDRIVGIQTLFWDITQRKQAEHALRESERRFRRYFELGLIGMAVATPDGRFLEVNDTLCQILGYSAEELTDLRWQTLIVAEDVPREQREHDRVLAGERDGYSVSIRMRRRDGQIVHTSLSVKCLRREDGSVDYLLALLQDVTNEKRAAEALARQALVFETIHDGVIILDRDSCVVDWNHAAEQILGWSREETLKRSIDEFMPIRQTLSPGVFRECGGPDNGSATADSGPRRWVAECALTRKDGRRCIVQITVIPLRDDGKAYNGAIVVCRDVTDEKAAQEKLRRYQSQLRSLASELSLVEERERRRLAAALHDHVGQTLALTKLKLGALAERARPARGRVAEFIERLLVRIGLKAQAWTTAEHEAAFGELKSLIEATIKDTRSLVFELSPPILYELGFESALVWLAERFSHQHGLSCRVIDDGKPKPLQDDLRIVLFQAVRELLFNVVKHAKANRAVVRVHRAERFIHVAVEDDGVGFDPAEVVADAESSRLHGFGLFSIKERLDFLGASMHIDSARGCGTRIVMVAPLSEAADEDETPAPLAVAPHVVSAERLNRHEVYESDTEVLDDGGRQ
ncbi:MAG: PAS domain S-box protein [Planctomycetota bacterium]|nr:MAG: PAS domain S-box protein [Planctomycetota bacterium]